MNNTKIIILFLIFFISPAFGMELMQLKEKILTLPEVPTLKALCIRVYKKNKRNPKKIILTKDVADLIKSYELLSSKTINQQLGAALYMQDKQRAQECLEYKETLDLGIDLGTALQNFKVGFNSTRVINDPRTTLKVKYNRSMHMCGVLCGIFGLPITFLVFSYFIAYFANTSR